MEEYRKIKGFENYEVSNIGNVRNVETGRILKQSTDKKGYKKLGLRKDNVKYTSRVHRLVAEAFIPNPNNKQFVDHIDNKSNNVNNLRWATSCENMHNRITNKNNTSTIKGVSFDNKCRKWYAYISFGGRKITIGYFDNLEDAKLARQKKAAELFGVFTNHIEKIKTELELLEEELNNL
jgi:hypothetical protein